LFFSIHGSVNMHSLQYILIACMFFGALVFLFANKPLDTEDEQKEVAPCIIDWGANETTPGFKVTVFRSMGQYKVETEANPSLCTSRVLVVTNSHPFYQEEAAEEEEESPETDEHVPTGSPRPTDDAYMNLPQVECEDPDNCITADDDGI
jgi:hypothetical protein